MNDYDTRMMDYHLRQYAKITECCQRNDLSVDLYFTLLKELNESPKEHEMKVSDLEHMIESMKDGYD